MKLLSFCLKESLFFNLFSIFILLAGLFTLSSSRREAFPHVVMDIMTVVATYPGSSPKEVEKLITIPVERALKSVDGIDKIHSLSIEGRSVVITTIDEDLSKTQKEKVKTDIQRAIDRMDDLPEDADKPVVTEVKTHHLSTIEVNLGGLPESELRQQADHLKDRLELIDGIASVIKKGWRDREFWVEVDPRLLKELHLSLLQIVQSLKEQNINLPAGTIKEPGQEFLIRTMGEINTPEEIQNVVVRTNDLGKSNQIKDVATVIDTFSEETRVEKIRGEKAITLVILKREKSDSIEIVDRVKKEIENFKPETPKNLHIETSNDTSYYVKRRLGVLIGNGWFGMILVLVSIFFFMSKRMSLITVAGIPFSFFTTFIIMYFFDISINMISMFGLIIVSGMLVDDSIVFAENIFRHMQMGKHPKEAALIGSHEVLMPVIGTVTTTIIAFLPLAFMSGVMGKFVWQIPAVVIIALCASLFEAIFILPSHCANFIDPKKSQMMNPRWFENFCNHYVLYLRKALYAKYVVLGGTFIAFVVSLFIGIKVIPFVLFPSKGIEIFFIRANAKVGTPLEETSDKMKPLEDLVATLSKTELDTFTTTIGVTQQDVNDPFTERGSHVAQISVFLTPESRRKRDADEIVRDLQKKASSIEGFESVRFVKIKPGPPIGKPISVEIRGDEFLVLQEIAALYKKELQTYKGVMEIEDSFEKGKEEFQIVVNQLRASEAGLTVTQIANTLRHAFEGTVATTIKRTDEEINIRVRISEAFRNNQSLFDLLFIPNNRGNLIPLKEISEIKRDLGISHINHYDYKRIISVNANIDPKETHSFKVNRELQKKFRFISEKYPGYTVRYGGEQEDTTKSLKSLAKAFGIAFLGILFILCLIFKSFIQPFIILLTLPLSVIGIVIAFLTHGFPFSFMAFLGMIGLSGVVVNNAIILIDLINIIRKENPNIKEAILMACKDRLRPVILTSMTTVFGLGPIAYGIGGNDEILKPAALALSWGLFFSTILTLFIIPCVYEIFDDAKTHIPAKVVSLSKKILSLK